jgi:hypothetical protein
LSRIVAIPQILRAPIDRAYKQEVGKLTQEQDEG